MAPQPIFSDEVVVNESFVFCIFVPNGAIDKRRDIICTIAELIPWRIYAALGEMS